MEKGDDLGKGREAGAGRVETREDDGRTQSKYFICIYENVTLKPIINEIMLIKVKICLTKYYGHHFESLNRTRQ
jgi:hypothetical protein